MAPNAREKASFLKENILPIMESGQLKLINEGELFHPEIDLLYTIGHTNNMMLPVVPYQNTKLIYLADAIPTTAHIPIPYVMGYDMRPLDAMKEKTNILKQAVQNNYLLFFEHDPFNEMCSVHETEKGIRMNEILTL